MAGHWSSETVVAEYRDVQVEGAANKMLKNNNICILLMVHFTYKIRARKKKTIVKT